MRSLTIPAFILSIAILCPLTAKSTPAQPVADMIEQDYQSGRIDYENKLIYQLMSVREPGNLPVQYKNFVALSTALMPGKSATPIFLEAWNNRVLLSPDGQAKVAEY